MVLHILTLPITVSYTHLDLGETEDTIAEKTGFSKKTIRHRLNIAKLDSKTLMEKLSLIHIYVRRRTIRGKHLPGMW